MADEETLTESLADIARRVLPGGGLVCASPE